MEDFSFEDRLGEIWRQGREIGLEDSDIYQVLTTAVRENHQKERRQVVKDTSVNNIGCCLLKLIRFVKIVVRLSICCLFLCTLIAVIISTHNPTRKFVTRNIQDLIYPVMTRLREISLPILARYPSMSSWYSEECLVENPLFDEVDIDCRICSENSHPDVVSDVGNFTDVYYNNGKIVIINNIAKEMSWSELTKQIDISEEKDLGSWKISGNDLYDNPSFIEQLSRGTFPDGNVHVEWKINRLQTLHVLREMLPRFYFVPRDTEISLHHQVFFDGSECKAYPVPISEFANVVLVQGEGSSEFTFNPSPHCENDCQSVSFALNASQVLFFNWVFWRPIRVQGEGISTLILSSFY